MVQNTDERPIDADLNHNNSGYILAQMRNPRKITANAPTTIINLFTTPLIMPSSK
jgi:hypothetical protein